MQVVFMKKVVLKLNVDPKKYAVAEQLMEGKGLDIESELSDSVAKFYKEYVPADTRKRIEKTAPISPLPHEIEPISTNSGGK